jgi:putative toxin-antitoxin system antitoxin component (TIGR02293 family)
MEKTRNTVKKFDTQKSIKNASVRKGSFKGWSLTTDGKKYTWTTQMERVEIIREGVPYGSLETISQRLNRPVKSVLSIMGVPQTTYNKKKNEQSLLDRRDSELVLLITELIDYGIDVFNNEPEKFQRWLKKPNLSLGGHSPESLLDTITGINEVTYCLNRLEYGNLA